MAPETLFDDLDGLEQGDDSPAYFLEEEDSEHGGIDADRLLESQYAYEY